MAIRTIRLSDDEILRKKSRPVTAITDSVLTLLDDMRETMESVNGVGLAAVQVGVLKRVILVDVGEGVQELINPEIVSHEGAQINKEGCLSLPGETGYVERPEYVAVKALNRHGEEIIVEGEDLLAIALCHEIDHTNGIIYTDRVIEGYEPDDE